MSWYADAAEDWPYRVAVTVGNGSGSASVDCEFTVPTHYDHFWNTIDSSGNELRIVGYDGATKLVYALSGFNKTNRACTFQVDGYSLTATAGAYLAWLYYGYSGASSGAAAVSISSPVTGYVDAGLPSGPWVYSVQPETPGATKPRQIISKSTTDDGFVWLDVTPWLERRREASKGSLAYEEVFYANVDVQTGGVSQATMFDVADQRIVWDRRTGRAWIRSRLKGGSSGTDYTLILTVASRKTNSSTDQQVRQARWMVRVRNTSEA